MNDRDFDDYLWEGSVPTRAAFTIRWAARTPGTRNHSTSTLPLARSRNFEVPRPRIFCFGPCGSVRRIRLDGRAGPDWARRRGGDVGRVPVLVCKNIDRSARCIHVAQRTAVTCDDVCRLHDQRDRACDRRRRGFAWALGLIAVSAVATVLSSLSKKRRNSRRGDRIAVPVTPRMALGCSAMMARVRVCHCWPYEGAQEPGALSYRQARSAPTGNHGSDVVPGADRLGGRPQRKRA